MDIIRKEIKFFVIVISHVEVSHEMSFYLLLYKNVSYCIWERRPLVTLALKFPFFHGDFNLAHVLDGAFKTSLRNFFYNECWLKFHRGETCNFYLPVKLPSLIDDGTFFIVSERDRKAALRSARPCSCNKIKWSSGTENSLVW